MAGITPLFDDSDLEKFYDRFMGMVDEKLLKLFTYLGETFVSLARQNGSYRDRTGNLRSSIGYGVVKDGQILSQDYRVAGTGSEGEKGVTNSRMLVERLAQEFSSGWVLVGVAGMDYAVYVENIHQRDVISSSATAIDVIMREVIREVANG